MSPLHLSEALDTLDAPRPRTLSYYLIYIFVVLPVWLVVPASYTVVTLYLTGFASFSPKGTTIFTLATLEVIFNLYYLHLKRRVSGPTSLGPGDLTELRVAFTRVLKTGLSNLPEDGYDEETLSSERPASPDERIIQLEADDVRALEFRDVLRTWFGRCPWSAVRLYEVQQWIYWTIFNSHMPPLETIPPAHREVMDETIELLQKRIGMRIPTGSSNGTIQPVRLTLDKVNIQSRPLVLYALTHLANWYIRAFFERRKGLRFSSYDGLEYMIRIPPGWNSESGPRPIVFVHGLGLGLLQYFSTIVHLLNNLGDRPLLVLIQPHVSQNIFHPRYLRPMRRHEITRRLAQLLHNLGWANMEAPNDEEEEKLVTELLSGQPPRETGVTMFSHSNGSCVHAWMLKEYPFMITRSCFVDPMIFSSWAGDMCYNWAYRPCATGMEILMRYFVGSEVGVANVLQRQFDWSSNSLWYEEIPSPRDPAKALFIIGGKDDIISPQKVKKYLTSHGIKKNLLYYPDNRHGQALMRGEGLDAVTSWLQNSRKSQID